MFRLGNQLGDASEEVHELMSSFGMIDTLGPFDDNEEPDDDEDDDEDEVFILYF